MKKLTAICLALAMLLSLGALFGVNAAEADAPADDRLSCGDDTFGAYLTVRNNAENHDGRILLITKESALPSMESLSYTVTFETESGAKVISETIESGDVFFRSVTAAGVTYHAEEGYLFFGVVVTGIDYSAWTSVSVAVSGGEDTMTFTLDYADAVRKDTENLLGKKASELYPVESSAYEVAPLSAYHYYDATNYTNMEIHEIRVPVVNCEVGDTLTVTVSRWMQYNNAQIGDVRGVDNITYQLVATEACERGFVTFSGLSISLPYGYSFFIGSATDTVELLFLPNTVPNVDPVYMIQHLSYIPIEIYGYSYESYFNEVVQYADSLYNYAVAPFVFMNPDLFSNSVVQSIDIPMYGALVGQVFTVQVVKFDYDTFTITDVYSQHELEVYQDVDYHWLSFDVEIEVPEGYTLAFGAPTDTVPALYDPTAREAYAFCNTNGDVAVATLAYRIFGYKCN